jgi:hypothetical protein
VVLLDASALIAALYGEPGADTVAEHLGDASVVTINLEEVAGRLLRDGMDMATARRGGGGPAERPLLSAASSWEVAVKYALGRLPLREAPETYVPRACTCPRSTVWRSRTATRCGPAGSRHTIEIRSIGCWWRQRSSSH